MVFPVGPGMLQTSPTGNSGMRYRVKAIRGLSDVAMLPVEAVDEAAASAHVRRQGYEVISVQREHRFSRGFSSRRHSFPIIHFSQELIALLKAGLTLVETIDILHRKAVRAAHKSLLGDLLRRLQQGGRFSQALEAFPLVFSPLYVATVRASERTGAIRDSLARYVDYQSQIERVRSRVVSASIYPVLLLIVGGLVALFLLGYVVPRFSRVYQDVGDKLPMFSRWLMQTGQIIDQHGAWVLTGGLCFAATGYYVVTRPAVRAYTQRFLWRLPVLGPQRRVYELAQFYRTMSMLLRSGLPVLSALEMAQGLLSPALRDSLAKAAQQVREGGAFSEAMNRHGLTTIVAYSMMMVAERSGNLGEMLDIVAAFHDDELARWIDWFTRLFEPILMAVIGVVIGLIVVFMYMPIFELAETIQ